MHEQGFNLRKFPAETSSTLWARRLPRVVTPSPEPQKHHLTQPIVEQARSPTPGLDRAGGPESTPGPDEEW